MSHDDLAIKVVNLSKTYSLWTSRQQKLTHTLQRLISSCLPNSFSQYMRQDSSQFFALQDININIKKGESWALIGVNGSGKSTLLKIIAGNIPPSSGRVEINGKVAILDYGAGFNGEFTGKENIYIKGTLLGLKRKKINQCYQSIVEFAEIGDFIHQPMKTYSSGMLARLGFAIMAHVDADIIITDEALAVGDISFVQKCMGFINDFLKKGTFLFVSHSMSDVQTLCKKTAWLDKGKIIEIGDTSHVVECYLNQNKTSSFQEDNKINIKLKDNGSKKEIIILGDTGINNNDIFQETNLINTTSNDSTKKNPPDNIVNLSIIQKYKYDIGNKNHISDNFPLFNFDENSARDAQILQISLHDKYEQKVTQVIGGETLYLKLDAISHKLVISPITSFQLLDRLGEVLFTVHNYWSVVESLLRIEKSQNFTVQFTFQLPLLPRGDYVFKVGIFKKIESTNNLTPLHVISDALAISCVTTGQRHGLVGIPMLNIKLKCHHLES